MTSSTDTRPTQPFLATCRLPTPMHSPKQHSERVGHSRPSGAIRRTVDSSSTATTPSSSTSPSTHPSSHPQPQSTASQSSHPSTLQHARCWRSSIDSKPATTPTCMHSLISSGNRRASTRRSRWTPGSASAPLPRPSNESTASLTTDTRTAPPTQRPPAATSRPGRTVHEDPFEVVPDERHTVLREPVDALSHRVASSLWRAPSVALLRADPFPSPVFVRSRSAISRRSRPGRELAWVSAQGDGGRVTIARRARESRCVPGS